LHYSESDKHWTLRMMGYRDAHWYIKDTWIGFSTKNIVKQVVAHLMFMVSWVLGCLIMAKLLPVACKRLRKQNLWKITDIASDTLSIPKLSLSTRYPLNFTVAYQNKKIIWIWTRVDNRECVCVCVCLTVYRVCQMIA